MFGNARTGAAAYARIGIDTGVLAASPHQLIVLLFEGAISAICAAQSQMQSGDLASKGQSISRAIDIIGNGLCGSLDITRGGDIAHNLSALYGYITSQLLSANISNDAERLAHAQALLQQLHQAWLAISGTTASASIQQEH